MPRRKAAPTQYAIISPTAITKAPIVDPPPAQVWKAIDALLTYANRQQPITPDSPPAARLITAYLTALSRGRQFPVAYIPGGLAAWAIVAMYAMSKPEFSDRYYVRRCTQCRHWLLATDKRRRICYSPTCKRAVAKARSKKYRKEDKKRRARVTLKQL